MVGPQETLFASLKDLNLTHGTASIKSEERDEQVGLEG